MIVSNLDLILEFISSDKNKDQYFLAYDIKNEVFPKLNEDQVTHMISEIKRLKPEVCTIETNGRHVIYCNGLTIPFLEKGGFEALFDADIAKEIRRKEIEDLEFKKTKVDLELANRMLKEYPKTKWFARLGFIIGIVLLLKELYILIYK